MRKAAFKEITEKKNSLSKVKEVKYQVFAIQPYLKSAEFNNKERNLLYSLRSRMYSAKTNFRKLYSFNLKCHIFEECKLLKSNTKYENVQ